jgi:osmotically-inducible protein OsmY
MTERNWDRERDWERGRRYRGEGYYGGYHDAPERERQERDWPRRGDDRADWPRRADERGFWDRAGDEVRSWFGDEEAQRRRGRDDREERGAWREREHGGWWPTRERYSDERRWGGGPEEVDREWARQWGFVEASGRREPERRESPRGWGYSGGFGAGAGYLGGRRDRSGSGGFEPGRPSWTDPERPYGGESPPRHDYRSERYGGGWRSGVWPGPHVGRGPRGYRRSDERIREDICEQMCDNGELDASEIEILVVGGEVTLQGSVEHRHDKRLAEDLAEQVSGVREVNNQIRVTQGSTGQAPEGQRPEGPRYRAA